MKAFSHINIGEKISFIIGCKNYLILVVSKKTDKPCANCTRTCAFCKPGKELFLKSGETKNHACTCIFASTASPSCTTCILHSTIRVVSD